MRSLFRVPVLQAVYSALGLAAALACQSAAFAQAVPVHKACQPADVEAALMTRESAQIGPVHAAAHMRMRVQQCEVERGQRQVPAAGVVMPAGQTLAEDIAARRAVIQRSQNTLRGAQAESPRMRRAVWRPQSEEVLRYAVAALAPAPELTLGRWSAPFVIPVVGVTAVLLHTGNIMFWSYDPVDYHNPARSKNGVGYIWNPTTRAGYNIPPPENIWCSGQTILSDGRVYVAGGNLRYNDPSAPAGQTSWEGSLSNYTFNPIAERWARQPDMTRGRWYPTVTQLADNRVIVTSGIDETGSGAINNAVELFTPDPNMDGIGRISVVSIHNSSGLYPQQFLLPSGKMLEAGPNAASSFLLDPATWNWGVLPAMTSNHYYLGNGILYTNASVTPARQLVMMAGGHTEQAPQANNEWLDGDNPSAGWKPYPQWLQARHNANTVILPDGTLLTVGGNAGLYGYQDALLSAELYSKAADDRTGTWQMVAPHLVQAAYHSTAILLPDATVLLSQDDMDSSAAAAFQHKAQVYSPPYLFKGAQPLITAAPAAAGLGQSFLVSTDRDGMSGAVLVAPGATTHGNDMHQRVIKLAVQARTNGLLVTLPGSAATVPPGYYMLFVLDAVGIPSVAKFVRVT